MASKDRTHGQEPSAEGAGDDEIRRRAYEISQSDDAGTPEENLGTGQHVRSGNAMKRPPPRPRVRPRSCVDADRALLALLAGRPPSGRKSATRPGPSPRRHCPRPRTPEPQMAAPAASTAVSSAHRRVAKSPFNIPRFRGRRTDGDQGLARHAQEGSLRRRGGRARHRWRDAPERSA